MVWGVPATAYGAPLAQGVGHFSSLYLPDESTQQACIKRVHRLFIDNRDRDRSADVTKTTANGNTAPFDFTVQFNNPNCPSIGIDCYENVVSAELKALTFPKIAGEGYVILDIAQFAEQLDSSDNGSNRTFAVAHFDGVDRPANPSAAPMQPGDLKAIKGQDYYRKLVELDPPVRLSRLDFKFRKYGGNVVTLGDVANVDTVSVMLELTTITHPLRTEQGDRMR